MVGLRVVGVDSSLDFIENETGAEIIVTSDTLLELGRETVSDFVLYLSKIFYIIYMNLFF